MGKKIKVSILICSFSKSEYLSKTLSSIVNTIPRDKFDIEMLIDSEAEKTGLANTTHRYMKLYAKSTGGIIVKSDDDVCYYPGWFEQCLKAVTEDNKIGYISPISHEMMKRIGVRHACDKKIPIEPNGKYAYEHIASGMCWVFTRRLWEIVPYSLVPTWQIDRNYSKLVLSKGLRIAALQGALISHLGQKRWKGIVTDCPGKPPSQNFRKNNPHINYRVF